MAPPTSPGGAPLDFDGGDGNDLAIVIGSNNPRDPTDWPVVNFVGGEGDDTLVASGLFAGLTFFGDAGNDRAQIIVDEHTLFGGEGNPHSLADLGPGNDFIEIIGPRDMPVRQTIVVDGGDGDDTLTASGLFGNLTFDCGAGNDIAFIDTTLLPILDQFLEGGVKFIGGIGNDLLTGSLFDDLLFGDEGLDTVNGGRGDDTISGGADSDALTGGPGEDKFVFESPRYGPDSVTDFTPGVDEIHINASNFGGGLVPGALDPLQFVAGSDPLAVGGQGVFLYDTDDGTLAWDFDGTGGNAPVTIAILLNLPALSASDFLIV